MAIPQSAGWSKAWEEMSDEVRSFLDTGIYRLVRDGSKVVFLDPVRILNHSYSRFWVSPSAYYSRSFETTTAALKTDAVEDSRILKKRKRTRAPRDLNESERASEKRHQVLVFPLFRWSLIFLPFPLRAKSSSFYKEISDRKRELFCWMRTKHFSKLLSSKPCFPNWWSLRSPCLLGELRNRNLFSLEASGKRRCTRYHFVLGTRTCQMIQEVRILNWHTKDLHKML